MLHPNTMFLPHGGLIISQQCHILPNFVLFPLRPICHINLKVNEQKSWTAFMRCEKETATLVIDLLQFQHYACYDFA